MASRRSCAPPSRIAVKLTDAERHDLCENSLHCLPIFVSAKVGVACPAFLYENEQLLGLQVHSMRSHAHLYRDVAQFFDRNHAGLLCDAPVSLVD